jgi:hypothetical protein
LQENPLRRQGVSVLYGWVKDSDSADSGAINAEEVEQLDDLLKAQDALKANIRVYTPSLKAVQPNVIRCFPPQKMAEKLDVDRPKEIRYAVYVLRHRN